MEITDVQIVRLNLGMWRNKYTYLTNICLTLSSSNAISVKTTKRNLENLSWSCILKTSITGISQISPFFTTMLSSMTKGRKSNWTCVRILKLISKGMKDWSSFKLPEMQEECWALISRIWLPIIINLGNVKLSRKGVKVSRRIINTWSGLSIFRTQTRQKKESSFILRSCKKLLRKIIRILKGTKDWMNFVWMLDRQDIEFLLWPNHKSTHTPELRRE